MEAKNIRERRAVLMHSFDTISGERETFGIFDTEADGGRFAHHIGLKTWSYSYVYMVRGGMGIVPTPVRVTCSLYPEFEQTFTSREDYENSDNARVDCAEYHTITEIRE